jgi:hypothetical protein
MRDDIVWVTSELVTQRELKDARVRSRLDLPEGSVDQPAIRLTKINLVQRVERFRAELNLTRLFTDDEILHQRNIGIR